MGVRISLMSSVAVMLSAIGVIVHGRKSQFVMMKSRMTLELFLQHLGQVYLRKIVKHQRETLKGVGEDFNTNVHFQEWLDNFKIQEFQKLSLHKI